MFLVMFLLWDTLGLEMLMLDLEEGVFLVGVRGGDLLWLVVFLVFMVKVIGRIYEWSLFI